MKVQVTTTPTQATSRIFDFLSPEKVQKLIAIGNASPAAKAVKEAR